MAKWYSMALEKFIDNIGSSNGLLTNCGITGDSADNRMAWQWAETLVEIRGTLADIRGTTK